MAEYELILRNETNGNTDGYSNNFPSGESGGNVGAEVAATDTGSANNAFKTFAKVWSGTALARQAFQMAANIAHRQMPSVTKNKINFAYETTATGIGIALAFGAGGPVGGLLAMGAVGLSYASKIEQYEYNKREEGVALNVARFRAGPSLNRSRTG